MTRSATVGGIFGIVRDLDTATVDLEISEDVIVRFDRRAVNRIVRDIPAEEADQHRVGDDEDDDDEDLVAEAPIVVDEPAIEAPANDDPSTPLTRPAGALTGSPNPR